ncbi:hypothetical protein [Oceaniglobus indicus]|uniref:hypothetical protein n=1 Tax=Oceaniglobus indicus TaxID=2047749 RepID=UPI000C186D9D|nr:hypothetical protein [Oceaniglobus indicus]
MRFLIFATLAIGLAGCMPQGAQDDPPMVGLAEAQVADDAPDGVPADAVENAAAEAAPQRGGLFGLFRRRGASGADDAPEIDPGTVLPFGQVASVCGVSPRNLGVEVDEAPREGRARFNLIDTAPDSTAARTQFITGFSDRCARQFTGALVLFGSSEVHETTRYAQDNSNPYSATDDAYEAVKAKVCGVRRNVPCPADRRDRLNREVVFVTIYPRFGADGQWFELMLSDGALVAQGMGGT